MRRLGIVLTIGAALGLAFMTFSRHSQRDHDSLASANSNANTNQARLGVHSSGPSFHLQNDNEEPRVERPPNAQVDPLDDELATILRAKLASDEKARAVIATLSKSGAPAPSVSAMGSDLARILSGKSLIDDWNCFAFGCYFRISSTVIGDNMSINDQLLDARRQVAGDNTLILTADAAPNKLAIIIPR